jgi:hypothetical protein
MGLNLMVGGVPLAADAATLKALWAKRDLAFDCNGKLAPFLDGALSLMPAGNTFGVGYTSDSASWVPDGSVVTIGLQGGIGGSIEVVNSGELVSYTDGLESPKAATVMVAAGRSYVRLTLNVTLSASVSGTYSGGDYGVKASASTDDTYAVTFCKAFDPATTVRVAVMQAFDSFVVPFTAETLTGLQDGDYLLHAFDGKVGFAVGTYVGVSQVLYAGQASVDVLKAFGSPCATLTPCVKPTVSGAVKLAFKMSYEGRFEALLWKAGQTGQLHLFKADTTTATTSVTAGLTIDMNAAVSVKEHLTDHLDTLSASLVQSAGGAGSAGGNAVGAVVAAAPGECQKCVDEATDKLTSWLNKANGLKTNLEVAIENTHARTLLAGFCFDLTSAKYADAWGFATKGDFYGALNTGAVTLDIGSGLENDYQLKTSCACNFFNLWHVTSWSDFSKNVSMVYAGNNTFHMVAKVGRTTETDSVGAMHSMDMYFSASADVGQSGPVTKEAVSLNIALNAKGDRKAAEAIALFLSAVDGGSSTAAIVRDLRGFNTNSKNGSVQLLVTIPAAGFGKIQCDAKTGLHDAANWDAFAQAADDLSAWPLKEFGGLSDDALEVLKQYSSWKRLNIADNGATAADRNSFGSANQWPQAWTGIEPSYRAMVTHSMWAGQSFMNFCAALVTLATTQTNDAAGTSWESLLGLITTAVKTDLQVDFLRPTALATIRLCKGDALRIIGPVGPAVPVDHFDVLVSL